jgi:RHS repeat-associated protein
MLNIIRKYKKLHGVFVAMLSIILVLSSMPAAFVAPAYAVGTANDPDPPNTPDLDTFKYMQIFSANTKRPMSYCFYSSNNSIYYYYPFVMGSEEAIISFTIFATQYCSLKLYEYNGDEMDFDINNPGNNSPYYVDGKKFDFPAPVTAPPTIPEKLGAYVGNIVGVQIQGNVVDGTSGKEYKELGGEEYKKAVEDAQKAAKNGAEPIVDIEFYGMNDMPLEDYLTYLSLNNNNNPPLYSPFIRNWVFWGGLVDKGGSGYEEVDDGAYVIVLEPTDSRMKRFPSYLPFKVDSSLGGVDELFSEEEFPILVPYGGDPVNMLDGSFTWNYTDLTAEGAKPLPFGRTYKSTNALMDYGLGYGWSHSFLYKVFEGAIDARVALPDGGSMRFGLDYDGSYISKEGSPYTFTKHGSGKYTLTKNNGDVYRFNADGNIASITYANGDEIAFTYNGGNLDTVSNECGLFEFEYDTNDRISKVTCVTGSERRENIYAYSPAGDLASSGNCDGDTLYYTYDGAHNVLSVKDFNENVYLENQYDDQNRVIAQYEKGRGWGYFEYQKGLTTWTKQDGGFKKVYMDDQKRVTAIEDNAGKEYYVYNEKNQLIEYTDKEGNTTSYAYDTKGNKSLITHPDGKAEGFEYNNLNQVTKATVKDSTGLLSTEQHYVYDARGNLTAYTDARENTSTFTYDSDNNMLTSTDAEGKTTSYTYFPNGNVWTVTDPLNNVTEFEYDDVGRLKLQINADTGTVEYDYSTAGKLEKITDPDKNEQTYIVNGNGYNTNVSDWMGYSTVTVYNDMNQPVSVTDAEDNTTTYGYDEVGQLILVKDALNGEISYAYDLAGRMISMTDARGNTWQYSYDAEGRMIGAEDPLHNTTISEYDSMGRMVSSTNARNAKTSYEYDYLGRTEKTTDALNNFSRNVYDENGNLTEQYDKNNNKWGYTYDGNNRMTEATDPLNNTTTYTYDDKGQLTMTESPLGAQYKYAYDSMGRMASSTDPENNETTYEYDLLGRLTRVGYADNTYTENEYNANGWLVTSTVQEYKTNPPPGQTSYTYNKNGQARYITDAEGGVTEYEYDKLGRTVSVTDAEGGITENEYDKNGNLRFVTDAMGGVTEYQYDELNRVVLTIDPMGNETEVEEYDENGNVKKIINADNGVTEYEYDLLDRLISYKDAENYTFSFSYDPNGNTTGTVDGRNNSTSTEYDGLNRAVKNFDQLNNYTETIYDEDGRIEEYINAEGNSTFYSYDLNGNVKKATDALGNDTEFTYDSMNRVETMKDAKGAVTTYTYTAMGLVETVKDALNGIKSYTYDLLGNLLSETNELGHTTTYTYDALSRPLTVTNPLTKTDSFTYDANSRITSVTDKNGNTTNYFYDANGNIVETKDALNNSSYFEYDAMNRLVKVTLWRKNSRQNVNEAQITLYQYDKRGLTIKEINAANNSTIYVYDGNGNLIQKTDADGYVTDFNYDPRNLVDVINYTGGKQAQFAYNNNGALVAMMDWNGTVNFALDVLDRITSVNDQNAKVIGYTYDAVSNQTSITYPDNTIATYTYDLLRRLTNLNDAENLNTTYQYDAASQLIATAKPNGWDTSYTYDEAGQLKIQLVRDPSDKNNKEIKHNYDYDAQGNILLEKRTGAGGQDSFSLTHTYDALNRLVTTTGQTGQKNKSHAYTYDSLGNLVYEKNTPSNNGGNEYWYNKLNQQIRKQVDGKDYFAYTFDKRGNLVKAVDEKKNNIVEQYVYDATNRMVKGKSYLGTSVDYEESYYIYNGLGYLVGNEWVIAKNGYGYHGVGTNLAPSEQVGGVVVCDRHTNTSGQGHINPTGKGHTTGGTTGGIVPKVDNKKYAVVHKDYTIDYTSPLQHVIMESESGDGGLAYRYSYGLQKENVVIYGIPNGAGSLLQKQNYPSLNKAENIVKLYYHQDCLGSTDYLTDNIAGKVTSYTTYDDFGELTAKAIVKMGVRMLDLVQEYTGHLFDQVLGLYYAKARMYDAQGWRFMAADLVAGNLRNSLTLNKYLYVLDNPLLYVDPFGLEPFDFNLNGKGFKGVEDKGHFIASKKDVDAAYKVTVNTSNAPNSIYYYYQQMMCEEVDRKEAVNVPAYIRWLSNNGMGGSIQHVLNPQHLAAQKYLYATSPLQGRKEKQEKVFDAKIPYYVNNKTQVLRETLNGGTVVFAFEGAGDSKITSNTLWTDGRYGAMMIVVNAGKTSYVTKNASTFPDAPLEKKSNPIKDAQGKIIGYKDVPSLIPGVYNLSTVDHKGYAALRIKLNKNVPPVLRYNAATGFYTSTADGIDVHDGGISFYPNIGTSAQSAGCQIIHPDDYDSFAVAVGIVGGSLGKGTSDKSYIRNKPITYQTSIDGIYILDRSLVDLTRGDFLSQYNNDWSAIEIITGLKKPADWNAK